MALALQLHILGERLGIKHNVEILDTQIPLDAAEYYLKHQNQSLRFTMVHSSAAGSDTAYICSIPESKHEHILELFDDKETNMTEAILAGVDAVGKSFSFKQCVYAYSVGNEYWSYGYCFGDKVTQFHNDPQHLFQTGKPRAIVPESIFLLASFDPRPRRYIPKDEFENKSNWKKNELVVGDFELISESESNGSRRQFTRRSLKHTISHGQTCEASRNLVRSVEVIYKCNPDNNGTPEILRVHEIRTCLYRMEISLPRLCALEEFKPVYKDSSVTNMQCKSVNKEARVGEEILNSHHSLDTFFDYVDLSVLLKQPRKNLHVLLADYKLSVLGEDIFVGGYKHDATQANVKTLVVYLGLSTDMKDIEKAIQKALTNSIGKSMYGPGGNLVTWEDSLIFWYHIFDIYGYYRYLARVQVDDQELTVQLIDPVTGLNRHGRIVKNNSKNTIEVFNEGQPRLHWKKGMEEIAKAQEMKKKTTTVTNKVTESVVEKVTETSKVTEKVTETETVTERVTEKVTEKVTELLTETMTVDRTQATSEPERERDYANEESKESTSIAQALSEDNSAAHDEL